MSDPRNDLKNMFDPSNRFANFGDVLTKVHAQGFRCHTNTVIEVKSPITAFCGLNGTGKSTLLHLAAVAYKHQNKDERFYLSDFFVSGTIDPFPFKEDATVEYKFWQEDGSTQSLTLSKSSRGGWQGYARRPERKVHFSGIGLYLPKIEKRDFIVRYARRLTVSESTAVNDRVKQWTSQILGHRYESISSNIVGYSHHRGEVLMVEQSGNKYSEAHMGFGEGRILYLLSILETLPEKSLILIEEPETSLHQSAQYHFGKYLIDVAKNRRHQIFLTTHSEYLLNALHSDSRIYLNKTKQGVKLDYGLTSSLAKSLMTDGTDKALFILVEDSCAAAILTEIILREDPNFLRCVGIYPGGDKDKIAQAVRTLKDTGLPIAAVRDGDVGSSDQKNIFKLPGKLPPEKEIFEDEAVKKHLQDTYSMKLADIQVRFNKDHHSWFKELANNVCKDESALVGELARVYVSSLPERDISSLTTLLKEASRK